jgi:polar amino acid transport system substrate-binding protein
VARLRGWGGVAAMAAVCALTVTAALTLLPCGGSAVTEGTQRADGGTTRASEADDAIGATGTGTCKDPERSLPPSASDGPTIDAIKKRGYLRVGVDQDSYKWGYLDPNKVDADDPSSYDPEGFDIDLVHAIADQILGSSNAKVIYRAIPTNQRISAIQDNKVDMVVRTMTITCDRLKDVAFSTAYFETGQQVLAPLHTDITGYDDSLKGKRVCAATSSTGLEHLEKKSYGAHLVKVPNQLDCLVSLQLGEADAIVTDGALAAGQAAQDPGVKLVGKPFTEEYYGVAMRKDADDLVRRVNHILEDYRRNGWQTSYDKWLKADLGPSQGPPAPEYS